MRRVRAPAGRARDPRDEGLKKPEGGTSPELRNGDAADRAAAFRYAFLGFVAHILWIGGVIAVGHISIAALSGEKWSWTIVFDTVFAVAVTFSGPFGREYIVTKCYDPELQRLRGVRQQDDQHAEAA